jgi:hypothetical protein
LNESVSSLQDRILLELLRRYEEDPNDMAPGASLVAKALNETVGAVTIGLDELVRHGLVIAQGPGGTLRAWALTGAGAETAKRSRTAH